MMLVLVQNSHSAQMLTMTKSDGWKVAQVECVRYHGILQGLTSVDGGYSSIKYTQTK